MGADYNIFDGLTIRNTEVAFWAGVKDVAGATGLTVRNCRIENVGVGITTQFAGSKDFYIADNVFLGRELISGPLRRLDRRAMVAQTRELLEELDAGGRFDAFGQEVGGAARAHRRVGTRAARAPSPRPARRAIRCRR